MSSLRIISVQSTNNHNNNNHHNNNSTSCKTDESIMFDEPITNCADQSPMTPTPTDQSPTSQVDVDNQSQSTIGVTWRHSSAPDEDTSSASSESDSPPQVCQRLIQVSFAKIVGSKGERGGAKLHKNLLILHVLQRARHEHRRSLDSLTSSVGAASSAAQQPDESQSSSCPASEQEQQSTSSSDEEEDETSSELDVSFSCEVSTTGEEVHEDSAEACESDLDLHQINNDLVVEINNDETSNQCDNAIFTDDSLLTTQTNDNMPLANLNQQGGKVSPRKRKLSEKSTVSAASSTTGTCKRAAFDQQQLTGLISVFNTGLGLNATSNSESESGCSNATDNTGDVSHSRSLSATSSQFSASCPSLPQLTCQS